MFLIWESVIVNGKSEVSKIIVLKRKIWNNQGINVTLEKELTHTKER